MHTMFLITSSGETEQMEEVMLETEQGTSSQEAAKTWVEDNEDIVSEWTE